MVIQLYYDNLEEFVCSDIGCDILIKFLKCKSDKMLIQKLNELSLSNKQLANAINAILNFSNQNSSMSKK